MNILHLDSAITGDRSASRKLSSAIARKVSAAHPDASLTYRDLADAPLDHLTLPAFGESEARALLEEFKAADIVVIGAPMYNFTISSQLKAWIDRIAIAGETFRYTENGAEGLMGGKRVVIGLSRGGMYGEESGQRDSEFAERYLSTIMAFMGITDVTFVIAEGLAIDEETRARSIEAALERVEELEF